MYYVLERRFPPFDEINAWKKSKFLHYIGQKATNSGLSGEQENELFFFSEFSAYEFPSFDLISREIGETNS